MTNSDVIAQGQNYRVTHLKIDLEGKTYFPKNITSIMISEKHENAVIERVPKSKYNSQEQMQQNLGCSVAVIGLIVLAFLVNTGHSFIGFLSFIFFMFLWWLIGPKRVIENEEVIKQPARTLYTLVLDTNSGKVDAYSTYDKQDIITLREAIELAAS